MGIWIFFGTGMELSGSERVASSIGGSGLPEETIIGVNEDFQGMADKLLGNVLKEQIEFINYDLPDSVETYEKGWSYWKMAHPGLDIILSFERTIL